MAEDKKNKYASYKEVRLISESETKRIHIIKDEAANRSYVRKRLFSDEHLDFYSRLIFLKHENLVRIYDVFREGSSIIVIEDYVRGQTLQSLLENGPLTEGKAADYMAQLCDTLVYLHSQKPPIVLGDIQPDKIIISPNGALKLLDFNTSGDPAAPEGRGGTADPRADIYAAGVLLRGMIADGGGQGDGMGKGQGGGTVSEKLRKVADRCALPDPGKRYQSVSALRKALKPGGLAFGKVAAIALAALLVCAGVFFAVARFGGGVGSLVTSVGGLASRKSDGAGGAGLSQAAGASEAFGGAASVAAGVSDGADGAVVGAAALGDGSLYRLFAQIASGHEKPAALLERDDAGSKIRAIAGDIYEDASGAFQEYYPGYMELYCDPDGGVYVMPACSLEGGDIRDLLLLEMSDEDTSLTYYSSEKESTYYRTSKADKGLMSQEAFQFVKSHPVMYENPVVFAGGADTGGVAGVYTMGGAQVIRVAEDGGVMTFAYANVLRGREEEPLVRKSLHKIDDGHYWADNAASGDKDRLVFNFTGRYLILFSELTSDGTIIRLQGIYEKER